ncbi:MAG: hypothetical protein AAGM38_09070 [Pseudomonadota bacterium]
MTTTSEFLSFVLAAVIGLGFFAGLSEAAAGLLVRMWCISGAMVLLALVDQGGRGLSSGDKRLLWRDFFGMSAKAAAIGLMLACVTAAIAAVAFGSAELTA